MTNRETLTLQALVSKQFQSITELAARKIVDSKTPQRNLPDALGLFGNMPQTCRWKRAACCVECQANFAVRLRASLARGLHGACTLWYRLKFLSRTPSNSRLLVSIAPSVSQQYKLTSIATVFPAFGLHWLLQIANIKQHGRLLSLQIRLGIRPVKTLCEQRYGNVASCISCALDKNACARAPWLMHKTGLHRNGELVPALTDFLCREQDRLFINCAYDDFYHQNLALPAKGIPRAMRFSAEGLANISGPNVGSGEPGVLARLCAMKTFMPAWFGLEPLSTPRCPSPRNPEPHGDEGTHIGVGEEQGES